MTRLRKVMLEELQRRNFSEATIRATLALSSDSPATSANRPIGSAPNISVKWQAHLLHETKAGGWNGCAQTARPAILLRPLLRR